MAYLILAIICAIICSIVAKDRNRDSVGWFFLGLSFSVIALVALLVIPKINPESMTSCPICRAGVSRHANTCPKCGHPLNRQESGISAETREILNRPIKLPRNF